jgi:ABC-type branched-subunit amino acid transport system ATPase component
MSDVLLEAANISINFGGLRAVDDVSFTVGRREIVGLIGPNGAGKTTTFNTLCGVLRPTVGQILFNGRDLTKLEPDQIARLGIARTFQNVRLFGELSLRENIMMGAYRVGQCGFFASMFRLGVHRGLEREASAKADHWLARLRLNTYADTLAIALPFGLQRTAELARAMAGEPTLLLLDEPATGLIEPEKQRLSDLLRTIMK